MRSIRKLYFQNASGERRGLNGENGVYAMALAGFGLTLAPDFSDLGRGFFFPVSDNREPQNSLAFTVVLTNHPYEAHQSLIDWLAAAGRLTIVYNPFGSQEYFRDVTIGYIQKGELNQAGWLELPCNFSCLTPWYLPVPTRLSVSTANEADITRYDYRYTDGLRYGSDDPGALSATIAGTGHIPAALELTFQGAAVNPRIRLTGNVSGKTFGECRLSTDLEESDTLIFSTRYEHSYVRRLRADGTEEDLLDDLDLSRGPFFHLPVDEPCTLTITADAPIVGRASLLIYYYYRSV